MIRRPPRSTLFPYTRSSDLTSSNTSVGTASCCASTTFSANISRDNSRSEEHTSELQSRSDLVCRLLLEKKKKENKQSHHTITNIPTTLSEYSAPPLSTCHAT